jgi:hypothetical protein
MTIKVSTILGHNTNLSLDLSPSLGGPLNTNNNPIENGPNPVTITGNEYPVSFGLTGQVLATNGFGVLYWTSAGSGSVTSVGVASIGPNSTALTIGGTNPVTSSGTIDFTLNTFGTSNPGIVPASTGGTSDFLRADGTWAVPSGGGGNANNINGGLANEILYQTAPNTTGFITAPSVPNTFLEWNGSAFVWATTATVGVTSFQTSLSGLTPSTPTTGAVTLAGTLGVSSGGTGATTASAAINNLLPSQAGNAGSVLTTNGTNVSWEQSNVYEIPFHFGDASPELIGLLPAGAIVTSVQIVILTAFNGIGATLSVGSVAGSYIDLMNTIDINPNILSVWSTNPGIQYTPATNVYIAITPGSGATQGYGEVIVTIT